MGPSELTWTHSFGNLNGGESAAGHPKLPGSRKLTEPTGGAWDWIDAVGRLAAGAVALMAAFLGAIAQTIRIFRYLEAHKNELRGELNRHLSEVNLKLDTMRKESDEGRRRLYDHTQSMHSENVTRQEALASRVIEVEKGQARIEGRLSVTPIPTGG